ncbi:MAG: hypothetical protein WCF85_21480 [Rhodospirillaceae bacterium]
MIIDASKQEPAERPHGKFMRGALNALSGTIPLVGGIFSAMAGAWSESEQERVNAFLRHWLKMIEAEMGEKERTIIEIMQRLDMHDEKIAKRIASEEYQSLLRKGFRDWAGAESEEKRVWVRNILSNAGATGIVTDDVVRLFMEWIKRYSELHFSVIGAIYNRAGITRGRVWTVLGRQPVREDSAEADLFKLLFRDLSTGGIIRQHRETDYAGNFIKKQPQRQATHGNISPVMKSAFDDGEGYELTQLGQQFVHYAMTDLPLKLNYRAAEPDADSATASTKPKDAQAEAMAAEEAA